MNKQKGYSNLDSLVWLVYFGFVGTIIILTTLLLGTALLLTWW